MYFRPDIERSVNNIFNLPQDEKAQDWPLEASDGSRVEEFLSYLETNYDLLSSDIKLAIMALILASFDSYIGVVHLADTGIEERIVRILSGHVTQYRELMLYWSSDDPEDSFSVSYLFKGLV